MFPTKQIFSVSATALLALGMTSGMLAPASAVGAGETSTGTSDSGIYTEIQEINGKKYTITWDRADDSIKISDESGKVIGTTTMFEVLAKYKSKSAGEISTGATTYAANSCSAAIAGAGIANSVLWGAAGLTAVAPPAGMAAAGGNITSAILTLGGLAC
ncbi:hypothetical protein [Rothia sp. ZJ932]|uniref:hypothetical protein n=1 Tax=Rothia sp. ZJ932 TaxID=2810516 RepID=UPI001968888F|nr:hypothetical protein [Rothia sp. ZJ932]QRZ60980.1 hypothetical protein JR346_06850 [Rothia sp. ZJ932]